MTKNKEENLLTTVLMLFAILAAHIMLSGFVLVQLWSWFVVPVSGLEVLTLPVAMGLYLTARFVTMRVSGKSDNKYGTAQFLRMSIGPPLVILGIGWVVSLFL
jgi:hypothetical protein